MWATWREFWFIFYIWSDFIRFYHINQWWEFRLLEQFQLCRLFSCYSYPVLPLNLRKSSSAEEGLFEWRQVQTLWSWWPAASELWICWAIDFSTPSFCARSSSVVYFLNIILHDFVKLGAWGSKFDLTKTQQKQLVTYFFPRFRMAGSKEGVVPENAGDPLGYIPKSSLL